MTSKGIILAGGAGTRLAPLTNVVSKQLLPVYDKPLIFYPLSVMLNLGITDIMIITSSHDNVKLYSQLLKDVKANFIFKVQDKPEGIAQSFLIAEQFIGKDNVCLMLGDNIFYGLNTDHIKENVRTSPNLIFGIEVKDPTRYGVMCFEESYYLDKIVEKPVVPPSNYAVPGIYFFDNTVVEKTKKIKPSKRGELEIVDVINQYCIEEQLGWKILPSEVLWFDCGEKDDLLEAANMIAAIQKRTGKIIGKI